MLDYVPINRSIIPKFEILLDIELLSQVETNWNEDTIYYQENTFSTVLSRICLLHGTLNRCYVVSSEDFRYVAFQHDTQHGRFATWNWQLTLSPVYNRISRNA